MNINTPSIADTAILFQVALEHNNLAVCQGGRSQSNKTSKKKKQQQQEKLTLFLVTKLMMLFRNGCVYNIKVKKLIM